MEDATLRERLERLAAGQRRVQPDGDLATDVGRLLRACACPRAPAASFAECARALSAASWGYASTLAEAHGMELLFYSRLATSGLLSIVPDEVRERLARTYQLSVTNVLLIGSCLRTILAAAEAAGCGPIPLKGTLLAHRYYETPTLRPMRDVDLLAARGDMPRLGATLQRLGYAPVPGQARATDFAALVNAEVKYEAPRKPMIELHWGLSKRSAYRRCLPVAEVTSRARTMSFDNTTARTLDPADELAFLCVHCAADHAETRLIWLADLARIIARLPEAWNWLEFARSTARRGLATPVALALGEAILCLDVTIPPAAFETLLHAAESATEVARWRAAWTTELGLRGMIAQVRGQDHGADGARFLLGAVPRAIRTRMHRS